jgi:hypothetical protein
LSFLFFQFQEHRRAPKPVAALPLRKHHLGRIDRRKLGWSIAAVERLPYSL